LLLLLLLLPCMAALGFFERIGGVGVSANLIMYLTGPFGLSTAAAAASVNAWGGTVQVLPLVGAIAADSRLGRYRAVVAACVLYLLVSTEYCSNKDFVVSSWFGFSYLLLSSSMLGISWIGLLDLCLLYGRILEQNDAVLVYLVLSSPWSGCRYDKF
jgi:dipeptide/tripeptide permease